MKVKMLVIILCCFLPIGFQNCSVFHGENSESYALMSNYPYSKDTEFFEDVQIIDKVNANGVWNYRFVAAVVSAMDEDSMIDVELAIWGPQGEIVCPRVKALVNRLNNHIQVDSCKSDINFKKIHVQVLAGFQNQRLEHLRLHDFDLTKL